ncbi:MAG: tetratricopeptide repeat protein [Candidatus Ozemobacteraceae bacterium]
MKKHLLFVIVGAFFVMHAGTVFGHVSTDVEQGIRALSQGELEQAEAALQRARLQEPEDSRIGYDLGIIQYRKRAYAAAAQHWERSLANAAPDLKMSILYNLGNARYRSGEWTQAVSAYQNALEMKEDPVTRYNLEQAQKKLREEQERQKQEQKEQGGDQNQKKNGKDGKNNSGDKKDGGQQQGDKGEQGKDQQGQQGQKQDQKPGEDGKSQEGSKDGKEGQDDKKNQTTDGKSGNASDSASQKDTRTASSTTDPTASGSNNLAQNGSQTPEMANDEEARKQEIAMGKENGKEPPPPPDVSDRAKAIKQQKMNPYLLERVLKQMEEREREVQLRYRREPRQGQPEREEQLDPFGMDAEQLREFFENRGRPRAAPKSQGQDAPNW